jgi:hypothetical protein
MPHSPHGSTGADNDVTATNATVIPTAHSFHQRWMPAAASAHAAPFRPAACR